MARSSLDALAHPAAAWKGIGVPERPARRIVSLLPSATEIVCALGLADRLVAMTHECDFPADALADVPRITSNLLPPEVRGSAEIDAAVRAAVRTGHGLYALDEAMLTELEPDLVLTQELCEVCAVAYPRVLEAARLAGGGSAPTIVSLEPHSFADVLATIRLVAQLAGVDERGNGLVDALRSRVHAGAPTVARATAGRPRVGLVEWLVPLFAPGHWVPEQIELAGGESVVGEAGRRSREAEWSALAAADPEVIVLGLCGFDLPHTMAEWAAFDPEPIIQTTAWKTDAVWAIDGSAYVSRPGPRLVDGVEILASILAGQPDERAARLPRASLRGL